MRRKNLRTAAGLIAVAALTAIAAALWTGSGTAAGAVAPTNSSPPTISGTTEEGKTLTAARGSWSGSDPITYAYAWKRCDADGGSCATISGTNASTYVLKPVTPATRFE